MEEAKKQRKIINKLTDCKINNGSATPGKREDIKLDNFSNIFSIPNFLSDDECHYLMQATTDQYRGLEMEYETNYRSGARALVRCPSLSRVLYERLLPYFMREDIANAHPYGFANDGVWKPKAMNDVFKFSHYSRNHYFNPHYDGSFVVSNQLRSIYTILIYLNEGYKGGTTGFFQNKEGAQEVYQNGGYSKEITPKKGTAILFNHDVLHAGMWMNDGEKFVVKSEIIFHRTFASVPSEISYKKDPQYEKAKKLYELSEKLEAQGNITGSTSAYLQALEIQRGYRSFPDKRAANPLSVSTHIYTKIFSELEIKEIMQCGQVCKHWHLMSQDSDLWKEKDMLLFPSIFNLEKSIHPNIIAEKPFLHDWYDVFRTHFLLTKSPRAPLCIDIGTRFIKYGLVGTNITHDVLSCVGMLTHNHYLIVGGGISDAWRSGYYLEQNGYFIGKCKPFSRGQVQDWDGIWIVLNSMFKKGFEKHTPSRYGTLSYSAFDAHLKDLEARVPSRSHLHPIVLAEGHIPFDKERLYHLMFNLFEVPSLCVVNSAVLAAYAIGKSNCFVVDCGYEGVTCTPVWNYQISKEDVTTYSMGGRMTHKAFKQLLSEKYSPFRVNLVERAGNKVKTGANSSAIRFEKDMIFRHDENFRISEMFFDSSTKIDNIRLPGPATKFKSIPDFVYNSLQKLNEPQKTEMSKCVLLHGGLANIPGFVERFGTVMANLDATIKVICMADNPAHTIVQGARNFAASTEYFEKCISRLDYLALRAKNKENAKLPDTEINVISELMSKIGNSQNK